MTMHHGCCHWSHVVYQVLVGMLMQKRPLLSKSVKCQGIILFSLHIKSGEKHKECESEGRSIDGLPKKFEQCKLFIELSEKSGNILVSDELQP